jgi:hypothetical protein
LKAPAKGFYKIFAKAVSSSGETAESAAYNIDVE